MSMGMSVVRPHVRVVLCNVRSCEVALCTRQRMRMRAVSVKVCGHVLLVLGHIHGLKAALSARQRLRWCCRVRETRQNAINSNEIRHRKAGILAVQSKTQCGVRRHHEAPNGHSATSSASRAGCIQNSIHSRLCECENCVCEQCGVRARGKSEMSESSKRERGA